MKFDIFIMIWSFVGPFIGVYLAFRLASCHERKDRKKLKNNFYGKD
jgi:hypothetical protein